MTNLKETIERSDKIDSLKSLLIAYCDDFKEMEEYYRSLVSLLDGPKCNPAALLLLSSYRKQLRCMQRRIAETRSSILELEIKLAEISASEPVYAKPFYLSILKENGGEGDNTNRCLRVTFELAPTQDETVKGHCKDFRVLSTSYLSKDSGVNFTKCGWDTMPLNFAEEVVRGLFNQDTFYRTTRWEVEHIQDHHYGIMIETEYRELIRPYHLHCKYNYFVNRYRYGQSELPQIDTGMIADPEVCYG